ncbi:response regulator [Thermodesulfobacteriota bacterium]
METTPRIIVVDDEKSICSNVEKILKKNHYEIVHATTADEALEKMAVESFSLLISDIVMPGKNGLELLKLVKQQWPLTKAVMMTAYASTDTAVKAIRMGALDYIPKPFTPDELRSTVEKALAGELTEAPTTPEEREFIDAIDLDIPFDIDEVAAVTGEAYAKSLGPSDMPIIEVKMPEPLVGFCETGNMVCDIFKKLGATCKAGTKTQTCPQLAKKKRAAKKQKRTDVKQLIGIDQPFDYQEVAAVTGPEYVQSLQNEGVSFVPYEELKKNVAKMIQKGKIDVDIPFDRDEVARQTGEAYADQVSRSDMPVIEITASDSVEGFCEVGSMVCDIFKKLGATCKAGTKTAKCPQLAKRKRAAKKSKSFDMKELISIDQPFNYEEVAAVTGPEYIENLVYDGIVQVPYETLKQNVARMTKEMEKPSAITLEFPREAATKNILVIDDEVAVNNNIRKILLKKGYQVDQAITKEEALESIASHPYKLILLDLKIPGVKGLELLQTIRDKNPEAKVIMITGYASIETAVAATRMGAVDYLPKPFTPDEIREATDKAFLLAA